MFLRAWVWLLVFDFVLHTWTFGAVRRLAVRTLAPAPANPAREIARCLQAVERARVYHLYPMTCLRRSLTLQKLLAGQGVKADLRIGVNKNDGVFAAHAWIEAGGEIVGERELVEEQYRVLLSQTMGGQNERS